MGRWESRYAGTTADDMGAALVAIPVLSVVFYGGAWLLALWLRDPGTAGLVSVGLGCAVAGIVWLVRRGRGGRQGRQGVPAQVAVRVETVEERNEKVMAQAWMEMMARDGKDERLKNMARSWLEGERILRHIRAERVQSAQFRAYQEWCVAARRAGFSEADLGLDEWEAGLTGFSEEGLVEVGIGAGVGAGIGA